MMIPIMIIDSTGMASLIMSLRQHDSFIKTALTKGEAASVLVAKVGIGGRPGDVEHWGWPGNVDRVVTMLAHGSVQTLISSCVSQVIPVNPITNKVFIILNF
jgi:hypothetical protein